MAARAATRARLVFPRPGVWTLTAHAGGARSKLGSVHVRRAQLVLVEPTGIDVAPDGSLLVVEFGLRRLVRVNPATGRLAPLVDLVKPWGVARARSGSSYVSDLGWVKRIEPAARAADRRDSRSRSRGGAGRGHPGRRRRLLDRVGRLSPRARNRRHAERSRGHSVLGPARNRGCRRGSLLVSDTGNGLIRRVDPAGSVTTFAAIGSPRGIDVATDGTVYVAGGDEHRIVHLDASGKRLGTVGPRFGDAYALSVARDGTVYAIDIGADVIRRLSPDGTSTVVGRR